jgi:hypothetical protein
MSCKSRAIFLYLSGVYLLASCNSLKKIQRCCCLSDYDMRLPKRQIAYNRETRVQKSWKSSHQITILHLTFFMYTQKIVLKIALSFFLYPLPKSEEESIINCWHSIVVWYYTLIQDLFSVFFFLWSAITSGHMKEDARLLPYSLRVSCVRTLMLVRDITNSNY